MVLFVDFVRPVWFPFNLLNAFILRAAVFTSFIREAQDNQTKWEKDGEKFYGVTLACERIERLSKARTTARTMPRMRKTAAGRPSTMPISRSERFRPGRLQPPQAL